MDVYGGWNVQERLFLLPHLKPFATPVSQFITHGSTDVTETTEHSKMWKMNIGRCRWILKAFLTMLIISRDYRL